MSKWESNIKPYLREIEEWAGRGIGMKEIAKNLNVAYSTLRAYVKSQEELAAALTRGKNKAKRKIEKALAEDAPRPQITPRGPKNNTPYVKSNTPRPDQQGRHRGPYERAKKKIYATQEVCGICGRPVDKSLKYPHPLSPCIDHIIPINKGGHPSDINNLQLAHWTCNRQKSDKLLGQNEEKKTVEVISNRVLPQSVDWANYKAGSK